MRHFQRKRELQKIVTWMEGRSSNNYSLCGDMKARARLTEELWEVETN